MSWSLLLFDGGLGCEENGCGEGLSICLVVFWFDAIGTEVSWFRSELGFCLSVGGASCTCVFSYGRKL